MKTLYLSYDGLTDPLGQSQILPYLINLTKKGVSFTIISFEKIEVYKSKKDEIQKIVTQNNINWIPLIYTKKPPVLSTIKDIRLLKKTCFELYEKEKFDIVHCRSYITAIVGLQLKQKLGVKFVFDMRGFYADERVDGNIWNRNNPILNTVYNYFKKKEKQFLTQSDYIISLTENGKDEIESWKINSAPIQVIPCCADLNHFNRDNIDSELQLKFKNELGISENDFIISYLGSVGTWYMLPEMLNLFKLLLKSKPNAKLLFVTADKPEQIIAEAKNKNIPLDKIIIKKGERAELPSLLSLSTISMFFIKPVYSKKASSPTKMGELMGMGIPLICNSNVGDVDRIIKTSNCGVLIEGFTTEDYQKAISIIDELLKLPKEAIVKSAHKFYSLDEGVNKYYKVYQKLKSKQ